jgi:hypothetical protein
MPTSPSDNRDDKEASGPGRDPDSRRRELIRYAGLSTEVAASVGVSLFLGMKADKWLNVSFPILAWALPLLIIVLLIVRLIKASSGGKNGK